MAQYQPMYDSFNRLPERYVPTARMGVSANVYLPGSEVDLYTGQLKPEHQRRHRTQAQRLEHAQLDRREQKKQALQKEMEKGGVRIQIWKGVLLCWVFLCVCGAGLLWQMGQIAACQNQINQQEDTIEEYRRANAMLEEEIAAASDPAVICYAASQDLHMIPAESAKAIQLTAVDTRPLETAKRQRMTAMSQTEQVQTTPVPMTASN